jgi:hypothetical protein
MNQISVLYNHLKKARNYAINTAGMKANEAWKRVAEKDNFIELSKVINELENITLNLYYTLKVEHEVEYGLEIPYENTWVPEVLKVLSLENTIGHNFSTFHGHTLDIIHAHIRNWNHGYSVRSKLDEQKITELVEKFSAIRNEIFLDINISEDLKRVLIVEIDKILYALNNYGAMGEELVKNAVNSFYSNAFFNQDITSYYQTHPSFKEAIDALSASITIATFSTPLIDMMVNTTTKFLGS